MPNDRIKKLEEEYSRRVKDIKERQMKQKAQVLVDHRLIFFHG